MCYHILLNLLENLYIFLFNSSKLSKKYFYALYMPFITFIYKVGKNSKTYYGKYCFDYISDDHEGLDNEVKYFLHLWTFQTPIFTALKKYKNVKSILMVLLFLLLFGWRRSERRNMILKFCWSCLFLYPTFC